VAVPEWRTGWIRQLRIGKDDPADAVERWFDRFHCHWQDPTKGRNWIRYGPACVELDEAIAWCERHCHHAFINIFGRRWSIGAARDGFPALPAMASRIAREAERWTESAQEWWVVEVALRLGPHDFEDAGPIFERSLRALAEVHRCSLDPTRGRLSAQMHVRAPTLDLARELARHLARQAASDLPDGLRDETGEVFGATVVNRLEDTPGREGPGQVDGVLLTRSSRNDVGGGHMRLRGIWLL
jgi:hypothetical protein